MAQPLPFRFVWPIALLSVSLVALCAVLMSFLLRQQARIAAVMGENIESRRAAADLEESLTDLVALLKVRVEGVAPLHERAGGHLARIVRLVDHEEERRLADRLVASFGHYLELWRHLPAPGPGHERGVRRALAHLESNTLRRCQELRDYNDQRIEAVAEDHRQALRELAWGVGGVGVTGAVAGLLLGYLWARALRQSLRRLEVHIKDAAGKLAPAGPQIVLTGEGEFEGLHGQLEGLMRQIEEVVARLQQSEREVRRAEHLAAVGQLAAGVGHELRNPLTSIKMLVQAGREEGDGLPADDLEVVEREVRRMERSLQSFLSFTRPARLERRPLDLAGLLRPTLELTRGRADQQGVRIEVHAPPRPLVAFVDGEQLHQVLVNLCLNALDAMPGGGLLRLALRPAPGGTAEIEVTDSGSGFSPEVLPRLFEPFVSSKETGLGLGLVISRRIVEDHGGSLTAGNRPEGGACVTVRVPLNEV